MPIFAPFGFIVDKYVSSISATGGQIFTIISSSEAYQVHYFTQSGDFTVLSGDDSVEYLIVGGGGGSAEFSGAGGAGGVLTGSLFPQQQTYSVVVGDGGPEKLTTAIGNQGTGSSAFGLTAIGGGAGAGSSTALQGGTGGSGGGGAPRNGAGGLGTSPQGRNGGAGRNVTTGNDVGSGGGGGFSTTGGNGGFRVGGNGGTGLDISNTFSSLFSAPLFSGSLNKSGYVAGGGGGFGDSRNGTSTPGARGLGGGGLGGQVAFTVDNEAGFPNSGGGAGGGVPGGDGKSGGSGLVLVKYKGGSGDSDALAFINAAATLNANQETAINELVVNLKDAALWDKLIALYPFIGGTASTHKWNLKDPRDLDAAFRLTFSGTPTHDSNGITGNGTDAYYNTYINPSTNLSQNNVSAFVYARTNTTNVDYGVLDGSGFQSSGRNPSDAWFSRCMSSVANSSSTPASTDSVGFWTLSRTSSTTYLKSKNKTHTTITNTSVTPPNRVIYGLCLNNVGTPFAYTNRNQALLGFGTGLTTAEIEDLVDINTIFQGTLSRYAG